MYSGQSWEGAGGRGIADRKISTRQKIKIKELDPPPSFFSFLHFVFGPERNNIQNIAPRNCQ